MKTAKFTRRNAERFCCTHPTPVLQCLPWTPVITCPQPVEEKRARAFPGTSSWFYQVPRKTRRAKERQRWLIFVALQESLLGKLGADWVLVPKLRGQNSWQRGKWGRGWSGISLVQCVSSPPLMVLLLPVGAKCPVSLILKVAYACGSNGKHSLWFQRGNFIPIWSLRENPSPRALHGTWWMVSEWMRANQRWIIDQCCWLSGWRICL